ncbi:MAG: S9 family peptidase [Mariniblastus sp.]|nr:S9 family peptidase [Mariniblastus sp.]
MSKTLALYAGCLLTALLPCLTISGQQDVKQYTIEQFLKTTSYRGASFSPDNSKLLVSDDSTGVFNAYSIDIKTDKSTQLTHSKTDSVFTVSYFPNDDRFLYTADQGGNELNHLFVRETDGKVTDLTPGEKLKAQFAGWSANDKYFFVLSNERDPRYFDVYEYKTECLERDMIFKNEDGFNFGDISPDRQTLAFSKTTNRDDSNIYLLDRDSGEMKLITPHEGEINFAPAAFTPDGKELVYITDRDSDFKYLEKFDLATAKTSPVLKSDWDVSTAYFSKHGKYFVVGTNEDAKTHIQVYDFSTMKPYPVPEIPGASISSFRISSNEKDVAIYASDSRMPNDLFYAQMPDGKPRKLTRSLNSEINPNDLVDGKVVRFKSFDGTTIPGILFKPHQAGPDAKVPALVWVHGGPGGQSRVGYRGLIQYLVNHGYAIFAINNRGSSGYGKKFEQMDNRNHGKNDLMDCVTSKQMLINTGFVEPDRIGIIGGSYGGYMTLAALTFQPDAFECGIDIFGISNWYRTVQSIPPWWESQRKSLEKELGDFSDEEYFKSISPLFHSNQIKKPLMVLQGANDPRVIQVESDEIVEAVRKNGVPVEYLVFADEGHGFRKKENQLQAYKSILEFVDTHLKKSNSK